MPKPVVKLGNLSGPEGNAYIVLARCTDAARRAGWSDARVKAVTDEMKSGDYDNLLRVARKHFAVR